MYTHKSTMNSATCVRKPFEQTFLSTQNEWLKKGKWKEKKIKTRASDMDASLYVVRIVPKAFKVMQNWIKTGRHNFKWIILLRYGKYLKYTLETNNNCLCLSVSLSSSPLPLFLSIFVHTPFTLKWIKFHRQWKQRSDESVSEDEKNERTGRSSVENI